jgi:hypothetical protein
MGAVAILSTEEFSIFGYVVINRTHYCDTPSSKPLFSPSPSKYVFKTTVTLKTIKPVRSKDPFLQQAPSLHRSTPAAGFLVPYSRFRA